MLKNIGLFCKRALQKRPVFCKETCIFKHPTHRSHPICLLSHVKHQNKPCHTREWVVSHTWFRHVTHMNEWHEWVMSHIRTSHVSHMDGSYQKYKFVISHISTHHGPRMNASCHAYEWVMSQIWMSYVTRMNELQAACHGNCYCSARGEEHILSYI